MQKEYKGISIVAKAKDKNFASDEVSLNKRSSDIYRKLEKEAIEAEPKVQIEEPKRVSNKKTLYPLEETEYTSLFRKAKTQHPSTYFAVFFPEKDESWDKVYDEIAEVAEYEDWESVDKGKYGVLKSYIDQIFVRCFDQEKVVFNKEKTRCCFNTGLLTAEKKDVFMIFRKKEEKHLHSENQKWVYECIVDSYSRKLGVFGNTPEIATFISNPEDLVFNSNYRFEVNTKHIVEDNSERLKKFFNVNDGLIKYAIEGALLKARSELIRNYRLAVPHWYKGSIQLLLPFDVNGDENPALTFILEKDTHMKLYRVKTVIPTEYAYINARVLRKLDPDWIKK